MEKEQKVYRECRRRRLVLEAWDRQMCENVERGEGKRKFRKRIDSNTAIQLDCLHESND
jgi:hypothetical protein